MKKIIIIIALIILVAGIDIWWQFNKKEPVASFEECVAAGNPVMESYPRQCRDGDKNFVESLPNFSGREAAIFTDKSLGITFSYPKEFGEARIDILVPGGRRPAGMTGEKLTGTFSAFPGLEFGGITNDFTAGREGLLTDTRGFSKKDGKYYFKFVLAKPDIEIQPLKIISKDFGEILILDDKSFEAERNGSEGPVFGVGAGRLAGLVNLKNAKFPGLVFYDWDAAKFSLDDFEALLNSLLVKSPEPEVSG